MSSIGYETPAPLPYNNGLFKDKKNQDLYWQALIFMGKNKKIEAEDLVALIKTGKPITLLAPWKSSHPETLSDFYDKLFIDSVSKKPETLTYLGLFDAIGIREHNGYLDSYALETFRAAFEKTKTNLETLQSYKASLDDFSFLTFSWSLQHQVEEGPFLFHAYPVTQLFGVFQELSTLFTVLHRLEVPEDTDNYIKRLEKIPFLLQEVRTLMAYQEKEGIIPPRFALEKSLLMLQGFLKSKPTEHLFYTHLLGKADKKQLSLAKTVLEKDVYPAYRALEKTLETLLIKATENHGVWALPDGDAYYAHCLKGHTTTSLTPQEIHDMGYKEVQDIKAQIRILFQKEGLDDPSKNVGELIRDLSKDPRFYYANTEEGRALCLEDFNKILERSRKTLWPLFNMTPKTKVMVERVPITDELGAPGAYYLPPSLDGSRPGIFYANLRDMREMPKYEMETLAVHEAEPGHHFQLSLQNEIDLPTLRKIESGYTAYVEGWALYTEKLAYEENFYSDSFYRIGHLQAELLRAVRLVVDTGIHYKKWSREEAIAYMEKETGIDNKNVVTEIERYFVLPGQACAYKIGQLKILELRKKAKDSLGPLFSIQEFHDAVLKLGAVPIPVLEKGVALYIEETKTLSKKPLR